MRDAGRGREAGVGIGTLYRHVPTRAALVEASSRNELTRLCASADELRQSRAPDAALRGWMRRFIAYLAADGLRYRAAGGAA